MRVSFGIAIAMLLLAGSAAAQSALTGNWSGTYSATIQLSACQNKTYAWNGNATVTFLENGGAVFGRLDFTNFTLFNTNCSTSSGEVTNVVFGSTDGVNVGVSVPNDPNGWQFSGTTAADTMTLQMSDANGLTGSVNLKRVAVDPPSIDMTGSWSGNYSFTDRCPGGSTKSYNGAVTLGATQSGGTAAGVLTLTNVPLYDQNCSTITNLNVAMSVAGVVSGSTFTGVALDPSGSFDFPFSATIANGAISGTVAGASPTSTSGALNLTQSNSQSPASDFSGRYDGTYSEQDVFFCGTGGILPFNGNATVLLTQAGNAISGTLVQEDTASVVSDGFGGCVVANTGEMVLPFYGTLANGQLLLTLPIGGGAVQQLTFNLAGDTISGGFADSFGDSMQFTTAKTTTPVPPAQPRRRAVKP